MANPTTYFGWVMPNSADLVTDLPADFAVFGQGVDTSMQYLLGGTTGQILSKTSGTNMAFTWIANDQGDITGVTAGTGISVTSPTGPVPTVAIDTTVTVDKTTAQTLTNKTLTSPALTTPTISTLTTNGDLLYGTGSGALARLGIGSTGNLLTVSGGLPVWSAPAGGGKVLQVIYAATTTSTNIATTTLTTTTLTASITPSSVSSKVLIIANNNVYIDSAGRGAAAAITTGATTLIHQTDTNNAGTFNLSDSRGSATIPIQFLHSPSTTSSITYTIKATSIGAANVTFQNGGSPSNILLFEIGA